MNAAERLRWWEDEATIDDVKGGDRTIVDTVLDTIVEGLGDLDDDTVLDYGCGIGRLAVPLSKRYPSAMIVGFDPVLRFVHAARDYAGPDTKSPRFMPITERGRPENFGPYQYDAAYAVTVFQHLDDLTVRRALYDIARALRIGGRFVCQITTEGEVSGLAFPRPAGISRYLEDAGFKILCFGHGLVYDEWRWITAERAE